MMKLIKSTRFFFAVVFAALLAITTANASDNKKTIKIGSMTTLEGTYTVLGEDGMRGIEIALREYGYKAGGYQIQLITSSSDTSPESAIRAATKLVEEDQIEILIGPLSGSEGLAIKEYAKQHPDVVFANGVSGAQDTTLRDPAENFFRFNPDGAQWSYGLGEYVVNEKGYKRIVTIGEDYSFIYTQVFGFALEYCNAGGSIAQRYWVPLGTKDFADIIASFPQDIDAIYLGLGGADAVNFLYQYQQAGGKANLIGGSIMVDQTVLTSKGDAKEALIGTPASGPQADGWNDPNWQAFVKQYQDAFPADKRFPGPSIFATFYYIATKAVLEGLNQVNGDLSNNKANLKDWLANAKLDSPTGPISLDENRQAIGSNFLTEVVVDENGNLINKLIKVFPNVNQTLGVPRDEFLALGKVGREVPPCGT